jgi:hypothetical protein
VKKRVTGSKIMGLTGKNLVVLDLGGKEEGYSDKE